MVSLLFKVVTHSSLFYLAQITAHYHFYSAQVVARWLEKHSSVKVDFVAIAQVGSTHRFSTAPESRRTVISIPPRWRQHSAAAYCCIWQAYVTAFGLAPGLTGQRLPFTSWLIGSVTRRHCGAVSLSRSLLTIVYIVLHLTG